MRRTLPVPIDGDCPSAATSSSTVPGAARRPSGSTTASSGFSRGSTPAMTSPSGSSGGHVLAAVHGEIDVAAQQRVFDFFHEQPLPADFRERRFLQPIARRLDDHDPARRAAGLRDAPRDRVGLPQRELAAAAAEAEFLSGSVWHGHIRQRATRPNNSGSWSDSAIQARRVPKGSGASKSTVNGWRGGKSPRCRYAVTATRGPSANRLLRLPQCTACVDQPTHRAGRRRQRAHVLQPNPLGPDAALLRIVVGIARRRHDVHARVERGHVGQRDPGGHDRGEPPREHGRIGPERIAVRRERRPARVGGVAGRDQERPQAVQAQPVARAEERREQPVEPRERAVELVVDAREHGRESRLDDALGACPERVDGAGRQQRRRQVVAVLEELRFGARRHGRIDLRRRHRRLERVIRDGEAGIEAAPERGVGGPIAVAVEKTLGPDLLEARFDPVAGRHQRGPRFFARVNGSTRAADSRASSRSACSARPNRRVSASA